MYPSFSWKNISKVHACLHLGSGIILRNNVLFNYTLLSKEGQYAFIGCVCRFDITHLNECNSDIVVIILFMHKGCDNAELF